MMPPKDSSSEVFNSLLKFGLKNAEPYPLQSFSLRKSQIEHPSFCGAIREIANIHSRGLNAGIAEGILIFAQTGSGKTTALKRYADSFPSKRINGRKKTPVVYVRTPDAPSVKSLAEKILLTLGDPLALKGTAMNKTERIEYFFKESNVQLLMIDEFQHFVDSGSGGGHARVTDWLKNLLEATAVPVVLSGLPRSQIVIGKNHQLRRRFSSAYYLEPFSIETEVEANVFRAVLKQIHEWIPVETIPLHESNTARMFYFASHGLIDYVIKIVDKAVSTPRDPSVPIGLTDFAAAFRSAVWRDAPDHLNPFCPGAQLRLLNKPREPFDIWDDPGQYRANDVDKS